MHSDNQIIGKTLVFETPSCVQQGETPAIVTLHGVIAGLDTEQRCPSPNLEYTSAVMAKNRREPVIRIKSRRNFERLVAEIWDLKSMKGNYVYGMYCPGKA